MPSRQEIRAEETKQAILEAAGRLFTDRGFDAVTIREIAKEAGCSHTTIYIYFKDKEALLHQLAMGPLAQLREQMESALQRTDCLPAERLRLLCQGFIRFCLQHRHIYDLIFMARATRVDVADPELEVNRARIQLFGLLRQALREALPPTLAEEQLLAYARLCFFTLHGVVSTYVGAAETFDQLMDRLGPTFDLAIEVMLAGIQSTAGGAVG
jgi:AcrR family transcriptional regulator